jgi:predicted glycosyltransferase
MVLYSHDTMGIGHMRRNLLIAQTLASPPFRASVLLIAGASEVSAFGFPTGVDCLTLPSLRKESNGHYQSRRLRMETKQLIQLRAKAIAAALDEFAPDVFVVDKVPRGALGELEPALQSLKRRGSTRCILGLRDVLDDPATVMREWAEEKIEDAVREFYDAVWVYGDANVYDPVREYQLAPDVAAKVKFLGYLDQRQRTGIADSEGADVLHDLAAPSDRLALCTVGGGQDGAHLAETFAQAHFPPGMTGVIMTGPFMPTEAFRRLAAHSARKPNLRILKFVTDADLLLRRADRVVAMGGYNTVCEVLSFEKPALIVPRVKPRLEQLIRAERLRDLGVIDVLHPDQLTPDSLTSWLQGDRQSPRGLRKQINMNGLGNLVRSLEELLLAQTALWRVGHSDRRPTYVGQ